MGGLAGEINREGGPEIYSGRRDGKGRGGEVDQGVAVRADLEDQAGDLDFRREDLGCGEILTITDWGKGGRREIDVAGGEGICEGRILTIRAGAGEGRERGL
jgi:hypothetical protein